MLYRGHNGRATWKLAGKKGVESVEVTGLVSADEMTVITRAIAGGAGVGLVPPLLASEYVRRGELEVVLPDYHLAGSGLYVVLPSSEFVPRRVTLLRDFLVDFLTKRLQSAQTQCQLRKGAGGRPGLA